MTPRERQKLVKPVPSDAVHAAEDDGFEDYVSGKLRGENPFPARSPCFLLWDRGWLEARRYLGR